MKKKTIIMSCLAVVLLLLVVGITYAAFSFTNTGSANTITSGKINFSYTEPSNSYTVTNSLPTDDTTGKASTDYFEFVISSNATTNSNDEIGISLPFEISISSVSVDSGKTALSNNQIKLYLTSVASGTETEEVEPTLVSELADSSYTGKVLLTGTHNYKKNSSAISTTYRLRAWIASSVDASSWGASSSYQYKFRVNVNAGAGSQQVKYAKISSDQDCDLDDIGCEVEIGTEHFYVIGADENNSKNVNLLAKYNLKVGNIGTELNDEASCVAAGYDWDSDYLECENSLGLEPIPSTSEGYNKQSSDMRGEYCTDTYDYSLGACDGAWVYNGILGFSSTNYWHDFDLNPKYGSDYPAYVYDENSNLYTYVEDYKDILEDEYDIDVSNARLLKQEELVSIGCNATKFTCYTSTVTSNNREWIYNTSTWLGSADFDMDIWGVHTNAGFINGTVYNDDTLFGIRPVISVSKTLFD